MYVLQQAILKGLQNKNLGNSDELLNQTSSSFYLGDGLYLVEFDDIFTPKDIEQFEFSDLIDFIGVSLNVKFQSDADKLTIKKLSQIKKLPFSLTVEKIMFRIKPINNDSAEELHNKFSGLGFNVEYVGYDGDEGIVDGVVITIDPNDYGVDNLSVHLSIDASAYQHALTNDSYLIDYGDKFLLKYIGSNRILDLMLEHKDYTQLCDQIHTYFYQMIENDLSWVDGLLKGQRYEE